MGKRIGKFTITWELIDKAPRIAQHVFEGMIVLRAESLYHRGLIEYIALSDKFEEVDEGAIAPEYMMEVVADAGHNVTVTARRITPGGESSQGVSDWS